MSFRCPFHKGGQQSFHVNVLKGVYQCWSTRCGVTGTLNHLLKRLGLGIRAAESYGKARDDVELPVAKLEQLPKELLYLFKPHVLPGFQEETCRHFDVRFDPRLDRVVYPIFAGPILEPVPAKRAALVGLMGRRQNPQPWEGKYKLYKSEFETLLDVDTDRLPNPFSELWGLHLLNGEGHVVVAEGFKAALAIFEAGHPTVVATMGTTVSKGQFLALTRRFHEVTIFFDNDEAGSKEAAELAHRLRNRVEVNIATYPTTAQQPDNLSPQQIQRAINEREAMPFDVRRKLAERRERFSSGGSGNFTQFYPSDSEVQMGFVPVTYKDETHLVVGFDEVVFRPGEHSENWLFTRCFCDDESGLPCPVHSKYPDAKTGQKFLFGMKAICAVHEVEYENDKGKKRTKHVRCTKPKCRQCAQGNKPIKAFKAIWQLGSGHYGNIESEDLSKVAPKCTNCGEGLHLEKASCPDCGTVLFEADDNDPDTILEPTEVVKMVYSERLKCPECEKRVMADEVLQCWKEDGGELVESCDSPERDSIYYHQIGVSTAIRAGKRGNYTELKVEAGAEFDPESEEPVDATPFIKSWDTCCDDMGIKNKEKFKRAAGKELPSEDTPY